MYQNIKTFEDACKALDIAPFIPTIPGLPEKHQAALAAHAKLVIIAEALNQGWAPDWNNDDEYKYYPWFDMENGFSFDGCDCDYLGSVVGSRLCFRSRAIAEYAGTQFLDLYKEYFVIPR